MMMVGTCPISTWMVIIFDVYGTDSIPTALSELKSGTISEEVCNKLRLFTSCTRDGNNYCTQKFPGSYVDSSSNIYNDINDGKTVFFFGFSEKIGLVKRRPYFALSWPFSNSRESNYMLQFTDTLVVNRAKWLTASEDKKNAIRQFIIYYTGLELRRKIGLGEDLTPQRNRYLLQALKTFYTDTTNSIYQQLYVELQKSVAISTNDRIKFKQILDKRCLKIDYKIGL